MNFFQLATLDFVIAILHQLKGYSCCTNLLTRPDISVLLVEFVSVEMLVHCLDLEYKSMTRFWFHSWLLATNGLAQFIFKWYNNLLYVNDTMLTMLTMSDEVDLKIVDKETWVWIIWNCALLIHQLELLKVEDYTILAHNVTVWKNNNLVWMWLILVIVLNNSKKRGF